MRKIIILSIYINLLVAQIQYGGSPIFYNQQFERINSVQINPNTIIDRNFDSMVFQFGREYLADINVISEAEVILNQDNTYTLLLSVSSEGAYGLGLNFTDFHLLIREIDLVLSKFIRGQGLVCLVLSRGK